VSFHNSERFRENSKSTSSFGFSVSKTEVWEKGVKLMPMSSNAPSLLDANNRLGEGVYKQKFPYIIEGARVPTHYINMIRSKGWRLIRTAPSYIRNLA